RLTRFSRIELESERDRLTAEIEELEALLASPELVRAQVSDELAEAAARFGTPRRTLLNEARASIATTAPRRGATADVQLPDVPCRVFLSTSGTALLIATGDDAPAIAQPAHRSAHDAVLSTLDTTTRSEIGAITNQGRLIRF